MSTPWFDYRRTSDHRHSHTVHEHRAPTDDSVRLLKEFEEAARRKIDSEVRLTDSPLDVVVRTTQDVCAQATHVVLMYSLGGERMSVNVSVPFAYSHKALEGAVDALQQALVAPLSRRILAKCFDKVLPSLVV